MLFKTVKAKSLKEFQTDDGISAVRTYICTALWFVVIVYCALDVAPGLVEGGCESMFHVSHVRLVKQD